LRAEGAARGVRVSALCPAFVDTPLLDNVNPGLPATSASTDTRARIRRVQPRIYPADRLARDVVAGMARNRALIIAPRRAIVAAWVARHLPSVALAVNRREVASYLRERRPDS
jgi:short-subunit dehydrogenase